MSLFIFRRINQVCHLMLLESFSSRAMIPEVFNLVDVRYRGRSFNLYFYWIIVHKITRINKGVSHFVTSFSHSLQHLMMQIRTSRTNTCAVSYVSLISPETATNVGSFRVSTRSVGVTFVVIFICTLINV